MECRLHRWYGRHKEDARAVCSCSEWIPGPGLANYFNTHLSLLRLGVVTVLRSPVYNPRRVSQFGVTKE